MGNGEQSEKKQEIFSKSIPRYFESLGLECAAALNTNITTLSYLSAKRILKDRQDAESLYGIVPKGALLLRMMEEALSEKTLGLALRFYVDRLRGKNPTSLDDKEFYEMLQSITEDFFPVDIPTILNGFINSSGIPVVRVQYVDDGTIQLIQDRLIHHHGTEEPFPTDGLWNLPVTIKNVAENSKGYGLLTPTEEPALVPRNVSELILFNEEATSFHRTFYQDPFQFHLIQQQLKFNHSVFSPLTRAMILRDHIALAEEGLEQLFKNTVDLNLTTILLVCMHKFIFWF